MAKQDYTLKFSKAYIDLENNLLVEVTKEAELAHPLMDTLKSLEGKMLDITFKETNEVLPEDSYEED